jgi:hypothetical protein
MNSRHELTSIVRSRQQLLIAFLALATLVLALVSTIPASRPVKARTEVSRSGSRVVVRRSQEPKRSCCGGDEDDNKPHTLAGSYFTLRNHSSAKLLLNNKGPSPVEVRPTIFAMSGEKFEPPAVTVAGNSYVFVNLADWAALAGPQFQEGGLSQQRSICSTDASPGSGHHQYQRDKRVFSEGDLLESDVKYVW